MAKKRILYDEYLKAQAIHREYLEQYGVKMPRWRTNKSIWLVLLLRAKGEPVHKDKISDVVRAFNPQAGRDQQVRHLKRDGWNVEEDGRGYHRIADPYLPAPEFMKRWVRESQRLNAKDFEELKAAYNYQCATCGAKNGEPHRHYGEAVKLQQGHRDPYDPLSLENMIPQCQFCNQSYKDDFVFDENGRTVAVASERPVLRARREVQERILMALKNG